MFHSARLQLTAWYLLIIMLISMMFSAVIFRYLSTEVDRFALAQRIRYERRIRDGILFPDLKLRGIPSELPTFDPELIEEIKHRLMVMLIGVNGGILLLSGGLGYILAGRTLKPIKEMIDEQNRFISDSSHELRTPLTSLKTAMEVALRDKKLNLKSSRVLLTESIEEVNKLQSLSDALLQLTQYEKPNGATRFETKSLSDILKKAVRQIKPLVKQKNITFKIPDTDMHVEVNPNSFHDLLVILFDNAVKYSNEGSPVEIGVKKLEHMCVISVSDKGIGISKEDVPHIFDRFYRADTVRTKSGTAGYGLGLSIAQKIVAQHKGTLRVESELGKGSTFIVTIPLRQKKQRT